MSGDNSSSEYGSNLLVLVNGINETLPRAWALAEAFAKSDMELLAPVARVKSVWFLGGTSMSKLTKPSSISDLQKNLKMAYDRNITKVYFTACLTTFAVFTLYTQLPPRYVCIFQNNRYLLMLWPLNFVYADQMKNSLYTHKDQCLLLASTSTAGIVWFSVFVLRLPQQIMMDKMLYKKYSLLSCLFALSLCSLGLILGIRPDRSLFSVNVYNTIYVNCCIILMLISFECLMFIATVDVAIRWLRNLGNQ